MGFHVCVLRRNGCSDDAFYCGTFKKNRFIWSENEHIECWHSIIVEFVCLRCAMNAFNALEAAWAKSLASQNIQILILLLHWRIHIHTDWVGLKAWVANNLPICGPTIWFFVHRLASGCVDCQWVWIWVNYDIKSSHQWPIIHLTVGVVFKFCVFCSQKTSNNVMDVLQMTMINLQGHTEIQIPIWIWNG